MNARQAKKRRDYHMAKDMEIMRAYVRGYGGGAVIARKMIHDGKRDWWLKKYGIRYIEKAFSENWTVYIHNKKYERFSA